MAIDRVIQHGKRNGYGSLCEGGLRMESFPMRLFRKGNKKFWDPETIDFSQDAADFAAMSPDEKKLTCILASQFMAGEESVAQDLQPFMAAMAAEGRLADEAYLTQFTFEEAKHMQSFRLWFDAVGLGTDLHEYVEYSQPYQTIFAEELPKSLYALEKDPSPAAQVRASITYNHVVEGCLALTGYFGWAKVCASRNILPGMQQLIKYIGDDERRHMAWGTFTCRRHVAADERTWEVVEERMQELIEPAMSLIVKLFDQFEAARAPFGIDLDEMTDYGMDKINRRLESIEGARGRPVEEIDEDYSPMQLEDTFAEEDEKAVAKSLAAVS
ncbi:R2-like ligand-binding oxidase [Prauserella oleivorans]|uniref:R2-like ligand binding oxidase n=5 Tax=Pseudonocardiaceae TaxID=2070 RepID=A0A2V4ADK5_9PSEU|nr:MULTISPECIES: R2-like ligand-binding oxidase [Pseudonocardiaceae]PXY18351.1 ribonucleotide-diphosphate reductase subunit beta [Prauserella coralliicola]AXB46190.1 ribonucleotide-diphosphate reductase subunit beta [Amycolatopsis albispora]MCF6427993.1 R2-like ligand-binding oxidase [Amycolatopsis tucumanensis]PXY17390.1 ribonucleotide-diphosphate reductase subunit beta [Prauserella muralis]PXY25685.1 ribonucleotide-diphosphate reductase subunit beta [Prauserella flavalba]